VKTLLESPALALSTRSNPHPLFTASYLSVASKLFFAARPERLGSSISLSLSLEVLLAFEEEQIKRLIIWGLP
jgi:hypothetical protein